MMPIQRRVAQPRKRLDDFELAASLCFISGWSPPRTRTDWARRFPWRTWTEFLDDFEAVEDELRETFRHVDKPFFADEARRYRDQHGIEALAADPLAYERIKGYDV